MYKCLTSGVRNLMRHRYPNLHFTFFGSTNWLDYKIKEKKLGSRWRAKSGNSRMWRKAPSWKLQILVRCCAIEIPSQKKFQIRGLHSKNHFPLKSLWDFLGARSQQRSKVKFSHFHSFLRAYISARQGYLTLRVVSRHRPCHSLSYKAKISLGSLHLHILKIF